MKIGWVILFGLAATLIAVFLYVPDRSVSVRRFLEDSRFEATLNKQYESSLADLKKEYEEKLSNDPCGLFEGYMAFKDASVYFSVSASPIEFQNSFAKVTGEAGQRAFRAIYQKLEKGESLDCHENSYKIIETISEVAVGKYDPEVIRRADLAARKKEIEKLLAELRANPADNIAAQTALLVKESLTRFTAEELGLPLQAQETLFSK